MKKVLVVMPSILPVPAVCGGAVETLVESLVRENEKNKELNLSVFTNLSLKAFEVTRNYPSCNFIALKESFLVRLEKKLLKKRVCIRKISVIRQVRRLLDTENYDEVVLENSGYLLKIFSKKKLLRKYDGKIFFHLHNKVSSDVDKKILMHCKLLTVSEYIMHHANSFISANHKFEGYVVKNGINSNLFSKRLSQKEKELMKKELNIAKDEKVIIFVGRIVPGKGVDKLIDAVNLMRGDKIVLIVVGSTYFGSGSHSNYENDIARKCDCLKDKVRRIGYVDNSCLWKYYGIADVAVFPSVWDEPAGLTMVEAAMAGLPVITTNVGGIPEYMSPPLAILLNNDDNLVVAIKDKLKECFAQKKDLYDQAKKYQMLFSAETMYWNFIEAIK